MKTFREHSLSFCTFSFATLFCTNTISTQEGLAAVQYILKLFIGETEFPQEKHEIRFTDQMTSIFTCKLISYA